MKKAILALTICAVIGGFSVTRNVLAGPVIVHVADASGANNGLLLEGQENGDYNLDDIAKQSDFVADQDRQNKLISGNTAATKDAQYSADVALTIAGNNKAAISGHESRLSAVEKESTLSALYIEDVQTAIVDHGDRLNGLQRQSDDEVTRAKAAEATDLATAGDAKTLATAAQTTAVAANTTANQAKSQATTNTQRIDNHESRITALEAANGHGSAFEDLKNEVDENRQRTSAAISGVAAMANIPQVIQGQTFAVGAGVGTTDGESALAVGLSARATEHVVVKASVSDDSQQNFVVGAGASYGW